MNLSRTVILFLSVVVVFFAGVYPAVAVVFASHFDPDNTNQLFELSEFVVTGTVLSNHSLWDGAFIYTDYQIEVNGVEKGALSVGTVIALRTEGGVVGDLKMVVDDGNVELVSDQEVRLYLQPPDEEGRYCPTLSAHGVRSLTGALQMQYAANYHWAADSIPVYFAVNLGSAGANDSVCAAISPARWQEIVQLCANEIANTCAITFVDSGTTDQDTFPAGGVRDNLVRLWWNDTVQSGRLGTTSYTYSLSTLELLKANISMYRVQNWGDGASENRWGNPPEWNQEDVMSVVLHEMIHAVGLGHSSYETAVMYPTITTGTIKRVLTKDDLDGLQVTYPNFFNGFNVSFSPSSGIWEGETVTILLQAVDENGDDTTYGPASAGIELSSGLFLTASGDSAVSLSNGVGAESCSFRNFAFSETVTVTAVNLGDVQESGAVQVWIGVTAPYYGPHWYVSVGKGSDAYNGSESMPFATLERAVDVLGAGETIHIASGTYVLTSNLVITADSDNATIIGDFDTGTTADSSNVIIDRNDEGAGTYGFNVNGASNVTIANLQIRNANRGIYFSTQHGHTFRDVTLTSNVYGLYGFSSDSNLLSGLFAVENTQDGIILDQCESNTLINIISFNNNRHGFSLDDSHRFWISGCFADSNTMEGFSVDDSDTGLLFENTSKNNGFSGFNIQGINSCTLIGNAAWNNTVGGIAIIGATNMLVSNDSSGGNNSVGFHIENVDSSIVESCTATGNVGVGRGFLIQASDSNVFRDNFSSGNTGEGIELFISSFNELAGNIADGNNYGFYIVYGSHGNRVVSNASNGNSYDGIQVRESDENYFESNVVTGSGRYGLYFWTADTGAVVNNTIINSNSCGVFLGSGSDSNLILGNDLRNDTVGLLISTSYDNVIKNNRIAQNGLGGIDLEVNSERTIVIQNDILNNGIVDGSLDGIYMDPSASAGSITHNNISGNPDKAIQGSGYVADARYNYYGTTDSAVIADSNTGLVADSWLPFRFSWVDTAPNADVIAPAVPTNISGSGGTGAVTITWDSVTLDENGAPVTGFGGYRVYRFTNLEQIDTGSIQPPIGAALSNETSFVDSNPVAGPAYYVVTAFDTNTTRANEGWYSASQLLGTYALKISLHAVERPDTAWAGVRVYLIGAETQVADLTSADSVEIYYDTAIAGAYRIEIHDTHALTRVFAPVVIYADGTADTAVLDIWTFLGDANQDDRVNDMDASIVTSEYGNVTPLTDDRADVTHDGVVDMKDVWAVQNAFARGSETP